MQDLSIQEIAELLKHNTLFEGSGILHHLNDGDLKNILKIIHISRAAPGNIIFKQGDKGDYLVLILGGEVGVYVKDGKGGEIYVATVGKNSFVGEMAIIDETVRMATVKATSGCVFGIIHDSDFWNLFLKSPALAKNILSAINKRTKRISANYIERLIKEKEELKRLNQKLEKANNELKETTAELIQTAKLSSLGELTAGIAHEIKQPLNNIQLTSQSMLMYMKKNSFSEEEIKSDLEDIVEEVGRMSEIIDHMRTFTSVAEDMPREKIDVNRTIDGVFKLMGQQLKIYNIEVKIDLDPNLPEILADAGELGQVFTNLIVNARDAVENFRETERKIEIKSYQNQKGENRSPEIIVEVKDNGGGISNEIKDRILEPFFTTKRPGKGTGLGLSTVDRILKKHRGILEMEGQVGKGSLFRVILPVSD